MNRCTVFATADLFVLYTQLEIYMATVATGKAFPFGMQSGEIFFCTLMSLQGAVHAVERGFASVATTSMEVTEALWRRRSTRLQPVR